MKFLVLVFDNIFRNWVSSLLTSLGTMVLVLVVTLVWTVLSVLSAATTEKASKIKAIVTEKWQIPSQLPWAYASGLSDAAFDSGKAGQVHPQDAMTWGFFMGATDPDPAKRDFDRMIFAFVMEPRKVRTMMDEIDEMQDSELGPLLQAIDSMEKNRQGMIVGVDRLKKMGLQIGDRITLYSRNFKDITLKDLEIVGTFPEQVARFKSSAVISREYFNAAMDAYERENRKPHPLADKTLNLVWLKAGNRPEFNQLAEQVTSAPNYSNPAVKCETASAGISTFLEAYRDLLWGAKWLLMPACMVTLALVIANAISISVREREREFAVLKVLGFRPWMILALVMGESLMIAQISSLFSVAVTYVGINYGLGGLPFQIAFFPKFSVPGSAFLVGVLMGVCTALVGSLVPAMNACLVKVSDVFARVT